MLDDTMPNTSSQHYDIEEDRDRSLYCSISLKWNHNNGHVNISMPGYIDKLLASNHNIAHMLPHHVNLDTTHRSPSNTTTNLYCCPTKSNVHNKSSELSSIMHKQ